MNEHLKLDSTVDLNGTANDLVQLNQSMAVVILETGAAPQGEPLLALSPPPPTPCPVFTTPHLPPLTVPPSLTQTPPAAPRLAGQTTHLGINDEDECPTPSKHVLRVINLHLNLSRDIPYLGEGWGGEGLARPTHHTRTHTHTNTPETAQRSYC